jgi:hypothetical protein
MLQTIKKMARIKRSYLVGLSTLVLAVAFVTLPVASASALNCRIVNAQAAVNGGGRTASQILYVPFNGTEGCKDINVRNIQNTGEGKADDHCARFNVAMYPTWQKDPIYTAKKTVCSTDPDGAGPKNGPVVPLAFGVKDGTKYQVIYDWESEVGGPRHTFQIVD